MQQQQNIPLHCSKRYVALWKIVANGRKRWEIKLKPPNQIIWGKLTNNTEKIGGQCTEAEKKLRLYPKKHKFSKTWDYMNIDGVPLP